MTPLHSVSPDGPYLSYYRHTLPVRLMHWINVVALSILLMSGLQIFNAHPALYWGKSSYSSAPPLLEIGSRTDPAGGVVGFTRILGREFRTTGVLGASYSADGSPVRQAFPGWIALPSRQWLAMARTWHFFFAWILVINGVLFVGYAIGSRHLTRDLAVSRGELGKIPRSVVDHLHFRHATGDAAKRYNVLQKLAYLAVIFGLLPLIVLMGLAMSPWLNSLLAGWVDIVGGRQSARTLHFVVAWLLVAFAFIHVFQVLVTGAWNNLRSMITGTYRVGSGADGGDHHG